MPKLARPSCDDFAIVRSMRSHALVHSLAQTWTQIGRNPAAALGNIAPNIGSIVAIEKDKERQPGQIFPAFLALNSNGAVGPGYLPATYAPFKVTPAAGGIANTTNPDGQAVLQQPLDAAPHARRQPAHQLAATAARSRTTTTSTRPRRA